MIRWLRKPRMGTTSKRWSIISSHPAQMPVLRFLMLHTRRHTQSQRAGFGTDARTPVISRTGNRAGTACGAWDLVCQGQRRCPRNRRCCCFCRNGSGGIPKGIGQRMGKGRGRPADADRPCRSHRHVPRGHAGCTGDAVQRDVGACRDGIVKRPAERGLDVEHSGNRQ